MRCVWYQATWLATILIREKLGYRAVMVEYQDTQNMFERMGSTAENTEGARLPAVHVDVEVWPNGKEPKIKKWVRDLAQVTALPGCTKSYPPSPFSSSFFFCFENGNIDIEYPAATNAEKGQGRAGQGRAGQFGHIFE